MQLLLAELTLAARLAAFAPARLEATALAAPAVRRLVALAMLVARCEPQLRPTAYHLVPLPVLPSQPPVALPAVPLVAQPVLLMPSGVAATARAATVVRLLVALAMLAARC